MICLYIRAAEQILCQTYNLFLNSQKYSLYILIEFGHMCDTIHTRLLKQWEAHLDIPMWEQYIDETFGAKSNSMQKKINGCWFVLKYPCIVYLGLTEKLDSLLQNAHKYVPPSP